MKMSVNQVRQYNSKVGFKFREVVKGTNLITRNFVAYYGNDNIQIEVSEGTDMNHARLFGVTVVKDGKRSIEDDELLFSIEEVNTKIKHLLNEAVQE